jgi:hypothetical protein
VSVICDHAFDLCSSLTSITIPSTVKSVGAYAFRGCSSLTSITIPGSVTSINNYVFNGCSSLAKVVLEDGKSDLKLGYGYNTTVKTKCGLLNGLPVKTLYLGRNCSLDDPLCPLCDYLTTLTTVTIGSSVTSIGEVAFFGCSSLTSITIPNSVKSIEASAFYGCSSLTSITIPNSVKSIEAYAFQSCSSLTSITIPSSVTSIGKYAFAYCSNLKKFYCAATTPPTLGNQVFLESGIKNIYVPSASVNTYKSTSGWSSYTSYIQGYSF